MHVPHHWLTAVSFFSAPRHCIRRWVPVLCHVTACEIIQMDRWWLPPVDKTFLSWKGTSASFGGILPSPPYRMAHSFQQGLLALFLGAAGKERVIDSVLFACIWIQSIIYCVYNIKYSGVTNAIVSLKRKRKELLISLLSCHLNSKPKLSSKINWFWKLLLPPSLWLR